MCKCLDDLTVYALIKKGHFYQGLLGVYSDYEHAKDACNRAAMSDLDDYHKYIIIELDLDCDNFKVEPISKQRIQPIVRPVYSVRTKTSVDKQLIEDKKPTFDNCKD